MLGIIIGISSVITIISVGNGLRDGVIEQMDEQLNHFTIMTNTDVVSEHIITFEDMLFLRDALGDSLEAIYSTNSFWVSNLVTRRGDFAGRVDFTVPDNQYNVDGAFLMPLKSGRYFTESDVSLQNPVGVIDELTALHLFGNTNVLGLEIEIPLGENVINVIIVGIRATHPDFLAFERQYMAMGLPASIAIELPYTLSIAFGFPLDTFPNVTLLVADRDEGERIINAAIQLLNMRYQHLGEPQDNMFIRQMPLDFADLYGAVLSGVTAFVALVASISLLVGGIGVMNIMLVSVTERTREIGIRRAIGAKTSSIIFQFLCESAILTGIGGVIGILVGAFLTMLITIFEIGGIRAYVSFPVIIIATLFSCGIGILFGIYPAKKAAKLNPIDALRGV
jgi:putative ABC transport system permease protein